MSKHLENLHIHQFRGLRDAVLSDLGSVNLLVGGNNSGKTSVLEAVSTYCSPMDLREWLTTAKQRDGYNSVYQESALQSLRWLFPQHETKTNGSFYTGEIHLSAYGSYRVRDSKALFHELIAEAIGLPADWHGEESNPDEFNAEKKGAELSLSLSAEEPFNLFSKHELVERSQTFRVWENERIVIGDRETEPSLPVRTLTPYTHRSDRLQIRELTDARIGGYKESVLDILRLLEPQVQDIEILSPGGFRPRVYIEQAMVGLSPLSAFGDGIRRTLMIALALPQCKGGILLIDEIEAAIHISALTKVFSWIVRSCRELDVQLFATTHSLEAVDVMLQAESDCLDDMVGYRFNRSGEKTEVKRFNGPLLHRLRYDRGLEVR